MDFIQLGAPWNHEQAQGDDYSTSLQGTIGGVPIVWADHDIVTPINPVNDPATAWTQDIDGDRLVLTAPGLTAGVYRTFLQLDGQELLAGRLRVRTPGTPGLADTTSATVQITIAENVVSLTLDFAPGAVGAAAAAVAAHVALPDPHPQYLTAAEGNAAYDPIGAASTAAGGAATALALHEADQTNVHGIADTALLETTAGAQAKADAAQVAAIAASQPVDSDLTAIAALATTVYGRSLLTKADVDDLADDLVGRPALTNSFAPIAEPIAVAGLASQHASDLAAFPSRAGIGTATSRADAFRTFEDYSAIALVSATTDCTAAITAALADTANVGIPIQLFGKVYLTQGGHLLPDFIAMRGAGGFADQSKGSVVRLMPNAGVNVFQSSQWGASTSLINYGITIADISIDGGLTGSQPTLDATHPQAYVMVDVALSGTPTTITVDTTVNFASAGTIWVGRQLVSYTGKTSTTFTGAAVVTGTGETIKANAWVTPFNGQGHGLALQAGLCRLDNVTIGRCIASNLVIQGVPGKIAYENNGIGLKLYTSGRFGLELGEGATDNNFTKPVVGGSNAMGCILIRAANNKLDRPHIVGDSCRQDSALVIASDNAEIAAPYFDRCCSHLLRFDTTLRGGIVFVEPMITDISSYGCNATGITRTPAMSSRTNNNRISRGLLSGFIAGSSSLTRYDRAYSYIPNGGLAGAQNPTTISISNGGNGKLQLNQVADYPPRPIASQVITIGSDTMTYTGKTRAICQLATAVLSGASTIPAFGGNTTAKDRMSDPFAASGRLLIGGNGVMTPIQVTYTGYDGNNFTGVSGLAVDLPAGVYITQDFLVGVTGATTTTGYADNAVISAAGQNAFTGMRVDLDYANLWTNPPQRHSGADLLTFGRGWMLNGNPSWFERVVTVLSGQTAIVTAHGLLATPTWFTATPHADPGSGVRYWVTADATNVTVTISSAAGGSGLAFTVTAECTPTS